MGSRIPDMYHTTNPLLGNYRKFDPTCDLLKIPGKRCFRYCTCGQPKHCLSLCTCGDCNRDTPCACLVCRKKAIGQNVITNNNKNASWKRRRQGGLAASRDRRKGRLLYSPSIPEQAATEASLYDGSS